MGARLQRPNTRQPSAARPDSRDQAPPEARTVGGAKRPNQSPVEGADTATSPLRMLGAGEDFSAPDA